MSDGPDSPPATRLGWLLLLAVLVFAAGLALALAWLPEWRAGRLPPETLFVERYRELAARAGVRLGAGTPRVSLSASDDDLALAAAGREGPRAVSPERAGVQVTVEQEGTRAGDPAVRTFGARFSPSGRPRVVYWMAPGISGFFASPLQLLTREQADLYVRLLLAPGETLGPIREESTTAVTYLYSLPQARPAESITVGLVPGNAVAVHRSPGTIRQALARVHRIDVARLLFRGLPYALLFLLVAGLFFLLASRKRIDLKNGAILAGITLAASAGGLFDGPADLPSLAATFAGLLARALWVFLAWSAGESFIRSTSPDFTTSLDALRAGRLGPRGGRALLSGLALGVGLAGLRLLFAATALALPGIWPEAASLRLPIFGSASPIGDGITLAAGALALLALLRRILPPRWVIPVTASVAALFLSPLSLHPFAAGFAANLALLLVLIYGGRRYGLTAYLTAAMASFLLPAAAFSALQLDWLPGSFALTAGDSLALLFLGLVGLRRPEQVELERLAPPAFIRRLEEERRVRYEMDLLSRMQLGLLPERVPELPGWQIAARSLLATEAGGDLYDFLELSENELWIAAGDVAGHGYSCSIVQAMTTAALTSVIAPGRTPSEVLREVDRVLRRGGSRRNFTSLALLRLDLLTGEALLANAGHPYPLLLENGAVREIALPGLPLGKGPKREYADLSITLPPGSVLVLCSDGLFEAANWTGDVYGYERPSEILRWTFRRPAAAILEALLADWRRHLRSDEAQDDTTVLVIKRRGG